MPRKRDSEAYESDGGFVEGAPKSKKSKKTEVQKREVKEVDLEKHTDDEGNPYFQLSKMRRISVSKFGGKDLLNIREYYEKDGKTLPAKKGISLTVEQFTALVAVLPGIEAVLSDRGVSIPRPAYERDKDKTEVDAVDDDEDDDDADESSNGKQKKKPNFEETSDEEED